MAFSIWAKLVILSVIALLAAIACGETGNEDPRSVPSITAAGYEEVCDRLLDGEYVVEEQVGSSGTIESSVRCITKHQVTVEDYVATCGTLENFSGVGSLAEVTDILHVMDDAADEIKSWEVTEELRPLHGIRVEAIEILAKFLRDSDYSDRLNEIEFSFHDPTIGELDNRNMPPFWVDEALTVTKTVVPGIPRDGQTQISLQKASNLATSEKILDVNGNPLPQSAIYLSLDAEIVDGAVLNLETGERVGDAVELAATGILLAPFEDTVLTAAEVEELSRPSIKQIYAVVANPDLQIAHSDAVKLADEGNLFDLSGNPLTRAQIEGTEALGMDVSIASSGSTLVRVQRADPLIVQEVRRPAGVGTFPLGTDPQGRDMLSRIVLGSPHIALTTDLRQLAQYIPEIQQQVADLEDELAQAVKGLSPEIYEVLWNAGGWGCPLFLGANLPEPRAPTPDAE